MRARIALTLFMTAGLLAALPAHAQFDPLPRIGLSASATAYDDTLEVELGEVFTLYACIFGPETGGPIGETISSVGWVVHQVCCGATMEVLGVEYNPELEHIGHPLSGMRSNTPACMERESLWLATLSVRIAAPEPGAYLWAAGPGSAFVDCEGNNPWFQGMPVTVLAGGVLVPNGTSSWGTVKALYR